MSTGDTVDLIYLQSLFLQGTPNPQPAFFLVAAAIRLSHSIGLHKRGSGFGLNPVEVEQRKRVFWIAYCLDKESVLPRPLMPLDCADHPTASVSDQVGHQCKMMMT